MEWYQYIGGFFCGAFFANAVPHFVQGISGNKFPTPFAKPPGKGLSSAMVNVLWGLLNLVIGYLLTKSHEAGNEWWMVCFFAGVAALGIMGGNNFTKKEKD